jgi:hypothetical protein
MIIEALVLLIILIIIWLWDTGLTGALAVGGVGSLVVGGSWFCGNNGNCIDVGDTGHPMAHKLIPGVLFPNQEACQYSCKASSCVKDPTNYDWVKHTISTFIQRCYEHDIVQPAILYDALTQALSSPEYFADLQAFIKHGRADHVSMMINFLLLDMELIAELIKHIPSTELHFAGRYSIYTVSPKSQHYDESLDYIDQSLLSEAESNSHSHSTFTIAICIHPNEELSHQSEYAEINEETSYSAMDNVNSGTKYVMVRIDIKGDIQHANFMLIDCVHKQVRIFEPNVGNRVKCIINYIRTNPDWNWLFDEEHNYKWAQIAADICPIGLQSLNPAWGMQVDDYCQTWTTLASLLYLENLSRDKNIVIKPLTDAGPDAKLILLIFSHALFRKYSNSSDIDANTLITHMQQCLYYSGVIVDHRDTKKDILPITDLFHMFKHICKPTTYLSYTVYKDLTMHGIYGICSTLTKNGTDDEIKTALTSYNSMLDKFRLDPLIAPLLVVST